MEKMENIPSKRLSPSSTTPPKPIPPTTSISSAGSSTTEMFRCTDKENIMVRSNYK